MRKLRDGWRGAVRCCIMLVLGTVASAALADEIAWPSDFWTKVTNRLDAVDAGSSSANGLTADALDATLKTSSAGAWITDFWSWTFDLELSAERNVDFRPAGIIMFIR